MNKRLVILLSCIFFLIALVVLMPANVVWQLAKSSLPDIRLHQVQGTVWSGSAASVTALGQTFNQLHWKLKPIPLMMARLDIDLNIQDRTFPFKTSINMDYDKNIQLTRMKGKLPARLLQQIPAARIVNLTGVFNFEIRQLLVDKNGLQKADGIILLEKASLTQPIQGYVGNLRFILTSNKEQIHVKIDDMNAPVKISGNLNLLKNHRFSFNALLKPTPAADEFLVSLLRNAARQRSDGQYAIQYNGVY